MSVYNINTQKIDPSMFKNTIISKNNLILSPEEINFMKWVENNAEAGKTYVSPEGHLVHGNDIIRSRQNRKSNTKVVPQGAPQGVHKEKSYINIRDFSKDTVEIKTKPNTLKNKISNSKVNIPLAEKKFMNWVKRNAEAGKTYVSPEGHLVHGDDIIRWRNTLKALLKR